MGPTSSCRASNLTDDLRARGVSTVPRIKGIFDVNAGVGGPLVREKVWFYGAYRRWGSETFVGGSKFFSATPLAWTPNPDRTRDAYDQNLASDFNGRLTSQISQNNKLSFAIDLQRRCLCYQGITGNVSPEATTFTRDRSHYWQAKWSHTATSRLLLQAGVSHNKMNWNGAPQPGVGPDVISVVELSTGQRYRSTGQFNSRIQAEGYNSSTYNNNFTANYVTGSHSFFAGTNILHARPTTDWHVNGDREYRFLNGEPDSIILRAMPKKEMNRMNDVAIFAADRWTINRLTLNLGLRVHAVHGLRPGAERASRDVPAGAHLSRGARCGELARPDAAGGAGLRSSGRREDGDQVFRGQVPDRPCGRRGEPGQPAKHDRGQRDPVLVRPEPQLRRGLRPPESGPER